MLDTHAIARTLTDAGIDSEPADAITATVRQAAGQGEHVTRTELRAELVSLELRLVKWIVGAGRPSLRARIGPPGLTPGGCAPCC